MDERNGVTPAQLEDALSRLRNDIQGSLRHTEDHLMTALFGFVNSASARMNALEAEDLRLMKRVSVLEDRVKAMEDRLTHSPGV